MYPLTGSVSNVNVQRVLIRYGVDRDLLMILVDDLAASIDHFRRHLVVVAMDLMRREASATCRRRLHPKISLLQCRFPLVFFRWYWR